MDLFKREAFHTYDARECVAFFNEGNNDRDHQKHMPAMCLRSNINWAEAQAKTVTAEHIDAVCASEADCKRVQKDLASRPYRDPGFQNPVYARGHISHIFFKSIRGFDPTQSWLQLGAFVVTPPDMCVYID